VGQELLLLSAVAPMGLVWFTPVKVSMAML
jgi:hypothetical protein